MAVRIPWDEQEVAVLIDAYVRVRENKISRQDAITEVSEFLRERAVRSGMEIDDIFRNENGIGMQYTIISGLMEEKDSGLHHPSKLFEDMVRLYKTDKNAFESILSQAKGDASRQGNIQQEFCSWLSGKVTDTQLSDYYMACRDIENYCRRKIALSKPFFEITDSYVIKNILNNIIKNNKRSQSINFRQIRKMQSVVEWYLKFLESMPANTQHPKPEVSNKTEDNIVTEKTIRGIDEEIDRAQITTVSSIEQILQSEEKIKVPDDTKEFRWGLNEKNSDICLKKASPVGFEYLGKRVSCDSWEAVYVESLKAIQENYPTIIRGMIGMQFEGRGVIVAGRIGVNWLNKAKAIRYNLFLETDLTPEKMIDNLRFFMDKCDLNHDKLTIYYTIKDEKSISNQINSKANNYEAFVAWMEKNRYLAHAMKKYINALNEASKFGISHRIMKSDFWTLNSPGKVTDIFYNKIYIKDTYKRDSKYIRNGAATAVRIYTTFLQEKQREYDDKADKERENAEMVKNVSFYQALKRQANSLNTVTEKKPSVVRNTPGEKYLTILKENFEEGIRPDKAIDRNRFRMYYADKFGMELDIDDEQLVNMLHTIGTFRNERIFVRDAGEQKDLIEEIHETVEKTFKEGASCIYLECLFARFQESLAEQLHIYTADALGNVLFTKENREYSKKYGYLYQLSHEPNPQEDVEHYMKAFHVPVSCEKMDRELWYLPLDRVKHILSTTPSMVNVAAETYLYALNFPISDAEIQRVAEVIHNALQQKCYISDVELMRLLEEKCPSVILNTDGYSVRGVRNALAYILRNQFSFRGAIISDAGEEVSMSEVFADYCRCAEHLTLTELRNFANELNTTIYWDSVYQEMVRISADEFVRKEQIHFDVDSTDEILDELIQSDYVPLKSVTLFLQFPSIEVRWNQFVLESYVAGYSKAFCLSHTSYTATESCGAIVRRQSEFMDYRKIVVDVLAKVPGWNTRQEALQVLVDQGYQQRKSYSDIENAMKEAKILREKRTNRIEE